MASSTSRSDHTRSSDDVSSEMVATTHEVQEQLNSHHELSLRPFISQDSRPPLAPHPPRTSSLPFPLNLPPSYPVYPSSSSPTASTRHRRPPQLRQSASLSASHLATKTSDASGGNTRVWNALSASSSRAKGKGTLDAFMDSRQSSRPSEPESSGSDSDVPLGKILALPSSEDHSFSDSSALPSSSPPSSSPLRTPNESSPLRPMYAGASSPTLKRAVQPLPDVPYVLPPGPYSFQKPPCSLSALIGQALNASLSGSLALNDIYSYVSTVYPYYDRADQSWMSSIRHNLSLQDAFERVQEQASKANKVKTSKRKGGFWRIKPGHEACFVGGSYVKKGAKGAGPGQNHTRKRPSQDDAERKDKRLKAENPGAHSPSATPISTSTRPRTRPCPLLSTRTIYSELHSRKSSSPPSLTTSQSTVPSEASLLDPPDLPHSPTTFERDGDMSDGSPGLPLALLVARRQAGEDRAFSSLEPGFDLSRITVLQNSSQSPALEAQDVDVNRDLFTRVLASTSSAHAFSSKSKPSSTPNPVRLLFPPPFAPAQASSSSPLRPTTPPRQDCLNATFSSSRTPMSHKGLHMSPSRSLAHYKSNLEPEWKTSASSNGLEDRLTPPPRGASGLGDEATSTPKKLVFPPGPPQASPFRTPTRSMTTQRRQRGFDPYDPNTVLADELASIRNSYSSQESPGGFFGKEGRSLLYESPGLPSRSHWRFRDEF